MSGLCRKEGWEQRLPWERERKGHMKHTSPFLAWSDPESSYNANVDKWDRDVNRMLPEG